MKEIRMGKAGRNETKRVAANFLNGGAVAVLVTLCIGPIVANQWDLRIFALGGLASAILHAMALRTVRDVED
jgi:hypothetical protein